MTSPATRFGLVTTATILAALLAIALAPQASAQSATSSILVTEAEDRLTPNETTAITVRCVQGQNALCSFDSDTPVEMSLWTREHTSDLTREVFCWDFDDEIWVGVGAAFSTIPSRCLTTSDDRALTAASFLFDAPQPLSSSTNEAGSQLDGISRNLSVMVTAEIPSALVVGNVLQQGYGDVQIVDSKDQLFGHAASPIEIDGLTESQLVQIGAFGLFLTWALSNGLFFAGIASIPPLVDPMLAQSVDHPFGFKFGIVLITIALVLEFLARNNVIPTGNERDPFLGDNQRGG